MWNPRLISKGVFFLGVYIRELNVLCKCSNICFGFLCVSRLKDTACVRCAAVKMAAFLKPFVTLAEHKEGDFTHRCSNTYFMRSFHILWSRDRFVTSSTLKFKFKFKVNLKLP